MTAQPPESLPRPRPPRRWWFHTGKERIVHAPRGAGHRHVPRAARILLVNQHYWPDHASTAQHLTDLAEALAEQGHDVHVLCARGGSRPGGSKRKRSEIHNNVTVHRVGATSLGRGSTPRRMLDYATFHLRAMLKALALPRFDIVVTLTTPPLIALIGQMLRMTRGTRHVYWSMDLHPDASLALRLMRKSRLGVRLLSWLSDLLYRRADRVVALGPYMEDRLLAKGVRSNRMSVVPVWGRRDDSDAPPSDQHPIRQQLGLTEKFVIMYSGNHGFAHRFDEIVEAARRLRHRDDIAFLFVGDGPRLHEVIEARNLYGLQNIFHLDFFPRSQLGLSLSTGDVHLVTLRQEMAGICVPSKVYGAMAAGRPVLFIGPEHCEVADTIRDANCGATVRPGDVEALVDTIELLAKNPAQVRAMGERGVAAFVAEYERDACCARWCWLIGELTGAKAAPLVDSAEPAPFALNHASPV